MNRENVIRLAREAGWPGIYAKPVFSIKMQEDDFLRFAALIAAAEREACARICDGETGLGDRYQGDVFAQAIRARGEK